VFSIWKVEDDGGDDADDCGVVRFILPASFPRKKEYLVPYV